MMGARRGKVEKIIGKREHDEEISYLVRWRGRPSSENQWIRKEKLERACGSLLRRYDQTGLTSPTNEMTTLTSAPTGIPIHKGYEIIFRTDTQPSKVIGADMYNEKLVHHIKWKNGTESLVYAADANKRIPQLVIAYYEQKLLSITNPKRAVV